MPYSQASDHSVTVGLTNTMLLISTPLVETLWRNLIHSWGSWQCHSWSRCGPRGFPLFSKWRIWFKKYHDGGMTCAVWLILPINDSSVSVLIIVEYNSYYMSVAQSVCLYFGRNNLRGWVSMSNPRNVLWSASFPSPSSLLKDSGSSHFKGFWWLQWS